MEIFYRRARISVMALLGLGSLLMLRDYASISWSFAHLPPQGDAYVFFVVSRGLLNGLRLYWDLFEVKPPLVLWLMAVSLHVKNMNAYMYLQIALLISLAPLLSVLVYRHTKNILATACTCLFGITLAYEIINKTAAYLPEGFGAPLTVYALLLFVYAKKPLFRIVVAGILIGIVAMIKEPFVASFVLAALIFCKAYKDLKQIFIVLCIGGITSLLILYATGSLDGYFRLYLPEMLTGRGVGSVHYPDFNLGVYYFVPASLWMRTLNAFKMFVMLATPLHSFFFAVCTFVCVGIFAPLKTQFHKQSIIFSFASIIGILLAAHVGYVFYGFIQALQLAAQSFHVRELGDFRPIIIPLVPIVMGSLQLLMFLALPFVGVCLYFCINRLRAYWPGWRTLLFIALMLGGIFCSAALVAFGGDYIGQYFGFVVPPFVALVMFIMEESDKRKLISVFFVLSALLILNAFVPGKVKRDLRPYLSWSDVELDVQRAHALDALLDACQTPQFFPVRSIQYYAPFMKHSPYQTFWGQQRAFGAVWPDIQDQKPQPYFEQKLFKDLSDAKIVVASPDDDPTAKQVINTPQSIFPKLMNDETTRSRIPEPIIPILMNEFTSTPPECASGLVPIDGLKLFFRKDMK